jgi:hypothetical protein
MNDAGIGIGSMIFLRFMVKSCNRYNYCYNYNSRKKEVTNMATGERAVADKPIDRSAISKMLMQLFGHWEITTQEQLDILGLAKENRSALSRYRKGEPIGASRDALERAGHILAIHKNLRLLFPRNRELAYRWMRTRNKAFDGRTPVEAIQEFGFAGLLMVRGYLDRMRGQ